GYPPQLGDKVAKAMPPLVMGQDLPLAACFTPTEGFEARYGEATELRKLYANDPEVKHVIDVATGFVDKRRQDGIHAAAVVITKEPLTEYLPVQRKPENGQPAEEAPIVTQYEMHGVEELGLLKMDFLGLRNLSVIERALDLVERSQGLRPDIDAIPLDDEKTFEMLRRADSVGVFQLEGGAMRTTLRALAPTSFDDVAALVALYRPGPMAANMHRDYPELKNRRKQIAYLHPDMETILGDTYGLMLYQESVMRVAQKFAGYSLEDADTLRKAAGKKVRSVMAKERQKFVAGCERNGYGADLGTKLFDIIEPFADYAFNKSHAYGYGLVAYQTAWLKANYPVEYLAALLTSVKDDKDKTAVYLGECRALGIEVLVPDVNRSAAEFTPLVGEDGRRRIVFGLAAVRNVGESLVERIVAEREAGGPFADFYDFCQRVDPVVLNKRTVESLVKAGAFDSVGHPRQGLCLVYEDIVDRTLERRREEQAGISTLFAVLEDQSQSNGSDPSGYGAARRTIPDSEFDKSIRLSFEKEMLGLYVSDHPLRGFEAALSRLTDCSVADVKEFEEASGSEFGFDGQVRTVGGVVTGLNRRYTKRGELMATFALEDLQASVEVFVFPKVMAEIGHNLSDDALVVVRGRVDTRDDQVKLVCMELWRPELGDGICGPLRVQLPLGLSEEVLERLKLLLGEHPGDEPVHVQVGQTTLRLPAEFNVDSRRGLLGELRVLLGPHAIVA
ncbi:MAG TPA: DNA polymerase III subunit alpha, partial [Acidimicrobiales bacterium]|nr:DNA polymerase III subunit alpha [Acidimicrobiales bacterium]